MFNHKFKTKSALSYSDTFSGLINRDYSDRMKEPTVLAAANLISGALANIPMFYTRNDKEYKPTMMDASQTPNPYQTMPEFLSQVGTMLAIYRQCYLTYETVGVGRDQRISRIECLDQPTQISIEKTPNGPIFKGVDNYGRKVSNNVLHLKLNSRYLDKSMDILDHGKSSVDFSLSSISNAKKYFERSGKDLPSGFVVFENDLNVEEMADYRKSVNSVTEGDGSYVVFGGGAKIYNNTGNLRDGQFIESRANSTREIAAMLGIPLPMLGVADATYKSFNEILRAFFTYSIGPILTLLETKLNSVSGGKVLMKFDHSSFLRADPQTMAAYARDTLTTGIISVNEARQTLGFDAIEGGDVFAIQTNNLTFGNFGDKPADPASLNNSDNQSVSEVNNEPEKAPA
ncbi:phage portal protein [Aeromonas salmonicida]|uniref:phage portal protein n=1 Tax=Aeromonas salmonicida TaxID=645 RepID=UPI003D31A878